MLEDRLIAWRDASSHNLSGILKFAKPIPVDDPAQLNELTHAKGLERRPERPLKLIQNHSASM